ncbi:MFS transporter [Azospirillum sp. TSO22-1]|uniref:MFS transporter n=1 Tax=Azospirillum sp. TSO22-1 TaxID=716789 RepID=UPI000D60BC0E|nr:MFS transporter [Azospirillum sp. TSO22-1]PWC31758.1 phosphoglycerate transporter [Azospirillum sp. TSO22-1]
MLSYLKIREALVAVPESEVRSTFLRLRWWALFGVFIGYATYYLVRNNFTFSTPFLVKEFGWTKADVGVISAYMLIAYGLSKGFMSSLADKCDTRRFMAAGLVLSAGANIVLGVVEVYWLFAVIVIANGVFQGMGAGPSFIIISKWFPRKMRGSVGAIWNISHNLGGGMVAPLVTGAIAILGTQYWGASTYWVPAAVALVVAAVILSLGVSAPSSVGLPPMEVALKEEANSELVHSHTDHAPESMSAWQIFRHYVLPNKTVWFVSFVDVFVYAVRFGVLTFLPLYLLKEKGFSKAEMGVAFAVFEWAAIPSTLFAGLLTDKLFKGRRMPLAMIAMTIILGALYFYWSSSSILVISIAAGIIGGMIYIPQFLASVQTIEVVPSFAVGSATGLRGLMSYLLGASTGTALFGILSEKFGWHAGFYLLIACAVLCIVSCVLTHFGVIEMERNRATVDPDLVDEVKDAVPAKA